MITNVLDLIRPNIKAIKPYSSARDEFQGALADMVFLDANENPFATAVNRYPDPRQVELKQLISKIKKVAPDQILLGNGSDEVLDLIVRIFCEPKEDNIITLPPTYGMYQVIADINAISVKQVDLSEDFQPQIKEILTAANSNSKIMFLCSPNNPSGNDFDNEIIEQLLENFNGIVVIDEAYIDFSGRSSWSERLQDYPNLIVIQTLSKAYGMAGIRLGMCFASAEIINILNSIKPPYNVNGLTQITALKRLKDMDLMKREVDEILTERDILIFKLKAIPFIIKVCASDANFLLILVDDADLRYKQLLDQGIVVRNRSKLPGCENCLRLTVGTKNENIKLINALNELQ